MPTSTVIPPHQAATRVRMERRVARSLRDLHTLCDDVLHFRNVGSNAVADRKALAEHHPEFAHADLRLLVRYWIILALPLAVWLVDVSQLSAVSEYLATTMFPNRPDLILVVRLNLAFALVVIELGIAVFLHHLYEEADESENRTPYLLCWAGALIWAAFVCTCVVATQKAAGADKEESTRDLMFGLTAACFLLHILLPAVHRLLHDAKGYLLFSIRDRRFRNRERAAGAHERAVRQQATTTFQQYARDINRNNVPAGPFSVAVRTVTNELFGEDTIPAPAAGAVANQIRPGGAPAGNAAAPPNPPAPHDDGANAENDYLRTILTRRQSEDESEVRA